MSQALFRAIVGNQVSPNRGILDDVPEPYRTTVQQQRGVMRMKKGSPPVEPREAPSAPISEEPT